MSYNPTFTEEHVTKAISSPYKHGNSSSSCSFDYEEADPEVVSLEKVDFKLNGAPVDELSFGTLDLIKLERILSTKY